ncbi:MAG: hypothetical protein ABIH42_09495 [Planctomycetota bacterium]
MYLAELQGKLSPRIQRMEDILTSNVFSFFKYSSRDIFLERYLKNLGFNVSVQQARDAEFIFWPRFEDNTEPDLVLLVGDYYILIEAKYFSGFAGETPKTKAQLMREIDGGRREARNYKKQFYLVVVTADSYRREDKLQDIPEDLKSCCIWTNWQRVSWFLYSTLEDELQIRKEDRDFAADLYKLLDMKRLRGFRGFEELIGEQVSVIEQPSASVFLDARTAKFRGDFIGFVNSLWFDQKIGIIENPIFLNTEKVLFDLSLEPKIKHFGTSVFYKRRKDE